MSTSNATQPARLHRVSESVTVHSVLTCCWKTWFALSFIAQRSGVTPLENIHWQMKRPFFTQHFFCLPKVFLSQQASCKWIREFPHRWWIYQHHHTQAPLHQATLVSLVIGLFFSFIVIGPEHRRWEALLKLVRFFCLVLFRLFEWRVLGSDWPGMCPGLWLAGMCPGLWLAGMCNGLWLAGMCPWIWLAGMCPWALIGRDVSWALIGRDVSWALIGRDVSWALKLAGICPGLWLAGLCPGL